MITDAWTFANMKMLTIGLRSCFVLADRPNPGWRELSLIWLYTLALLLVCLVLVAAAWEHPRRLIASSAKGFSTDRRARIELVAANWTGSAAWLLAMQLIDTLQYTMAQCIPGGSWHAWDSEEGAAVPFSRGAPELQWYWRWLLACFVFAVTSVALVLIECREHQRRRRDRKHAAAVAARGGSEDLTPCVHAPHACTSVRCCCVCSMVMKHHAKVLDFINRALVWTGALSLKRAIDDSVGLHGGYYNGTGFKVAAPANRVPLGFAYAGCVLLGALFVGMLVDLRSRYLLNHALAAAEKVQGEQRTPQNVGTATMWRVRYEFGHRWGNMLEKSLAYTSCSQTSTAVIVVLGSHTQHYWIYAFVSTLVGVLLSTLLANKCTLGKGGVTSPSSRCGSLKHFLDPSIIIFSMENLQDIW